MIDHSIAPKLKELQSIAIEIAKKTFENLEVGMDEVQATELMKKIAKENGVENYFHYPFAWFGDRTMFQNIEQPIPFLTKKDLLSFIKKKPKLPHFGKDFLPTARKLEKNMPVILDIAPMKDHYFVDIGYANFFGKSSEYEKLQTQLLDIRNKIPEIVKNHRRICDIYNEVQKLVDQYQLKNCHELYPLGVLGHKVGKYPKIKTPKINFMGFPPQAFIYLFSQNLLAPFHYNKETPYIAQHITQEISDGYWAIEPHIGLNGMGLKFEEILVIDRDNIYWLSETK